MVTIAAISSGGCTTILNANFEDQNYYYGSPIEGGIPGSPPGDGIHVTGETIGIHVNTPPPQGVVDIKAVTGNKSLSLGFGPGIGRELENGVVYFASAVIGSTNHRFTIFWAGKKIQNESTIVCNIGGIDYGTNAIPAFRVSAGNSNWTVVDAAGSHVMGPVVPRPTGQDAPTHHIDIDYLPAAGTYSIEIKQLNASTLSRTGNVFANTLAQIKDTARIGMWCLKTSEDASFYPDAYLLDGVVMREK